MLVVFDMDGVLIDSKMCMRSSWMEAITRTELHFNCSLDGITLLPDKGFESLYFPLIGRPFQSIIEMVGIPEKYRGYLEHSYFNATKLNSSLIEVYPGIKRTLEYLASYSVELCVPMHFAVLTSKRLDSTLEVLKSFGLDLVFGEDLVFTPNCGLPGKPSPAQLFALMQKTQSLAQDTIYIGDMSVDMQCARDADVTFGFALWGYGNEKDIKYGCWLSTPMDIVGLVSQVHNTRSR